MGSICNWFNHVARRINNSNKQPTLERNESTISTETTTTFDMNNELKEYDENIGGILLG